MNARRRLFCQEYIKDFNATRAAKAAGFSEASARNQGSRLMTNADIQREIKALTAERVMTEPEVKLRISEQARVTIGDFLDEDGVLDLQKVRALGHLVKSLTPTKWGYRIELVDGQASLFKMADIHSMVKSRSVLENPDGSALDLRPVIYIPDNGRKRTDTKPT